MSVEKKLLLNAYLYNNTYLYYIKSIKEVLFKKLSKKGGYLTHYF